MTPIAYFKRQAKNLFKDYKTQTSVFDNVINDYLYEYNPKYFDVDGIILDFDIDEDDFTLMNAQHIIANMAGFEKWTEMLKASQTSLKLSKLLFDNAHKISIDEWDQYIGDAEEMNNTIFDDEEKLGIFEGVFANSDEHRSMYLDYRLEKAPDRMTTRKNLNLSATVPIDVKIASLPLKGKDRAEFIKAANRGFETVMKRLEPHEPPLARKHWDADYYIDNILLTTNMLPINKDYALSLIDAFLVHHVINMTVQQD